FRAPVGLVLQTWRHMTKLPASLAGLAIAAQVIRPPNQQPRRPTQQEFALREQQASGVPSQVLFAEKQWAGADVLVRLLSSGRAVVRAAAVTAVGRLEDPRTVPALMGATDGPVGYAIAQALHGFDPVNDANLIERVWERLAADSAACRIRWSNAEQVHAVERAQV